MLFPKRQNLDSSTPPATTATNPVCIGLGTNLGDREANLRTALEHLQPIVSCAAVSDIFETEPVGAVEQDWFLNMVLQGTTSLDAFELLAALQQIENDMGRRRLIDKGPRIIDLDILLYSSTIQHTKNLTVPHPELHRRAFVLMPLGTGGRKLDAPGAGRNGSGTFAETQR